MYGTEAGLLGLFDAFAIGLVPSSVLASSWSSESAASLAGPALLLSLLIAGIGLAFSAIQASFI